MDKLCKCDNHVRENFSKPNSAKKQCSLISIKTIILNEAFPLVWDPKNYILCRLYVKGVVLMKNLMNLIMILHVVIIIKELGIN